ncbi:MAG: YqeG family HAD IIIA-type phosphatase [Clostridia bacterium]|nr:YqeG family HAD IIIA-type phosphatase [Clostridia bacterium]
MLSRLIPDRHFATYRDVTPAVLAADGIRALLLDIDNTLAPYEVAEPDGELCAWFAALAAADVRVALVSNNHRERVELFNRSLGLPAYPDAHKPLRRTVRRALSDLGVPPVEAAFMGDQLFTDVLAGKNLGMRAYTVPPIRDKRDPFTRFKRLLERPLMRAYRRREKNKSKETSHDYT